MNMPMSCLYGCVSKTYPVSHSHFMKYSDYAVSCWFDWEDGPNLFIVYTGHMKP